MNDLIEMLLNMKGVGVVEHQKELTQTVYHYEDVWRYESSYNPLSGPDFGAILTFIAFCSLLGIFVVASIESRRKVTKAIKIIGIILIICITPGFVVIRNNATVYPDMKQDQYQLSVSITIDESISAEDMATIIRNFNEIVEYEKSETTGNAITIKVLPFTSYSQINTITTSTKASALRSYQLLSKECWYVNTDLHE